MIHSVILIAFIALHVSSLESLALICSTGVHARTSMQELRDLERLLQLLKHQGKALQKVEILSRLMIVDSDPDLGSEVDEAKIEEFLALRRRWKSTRRLGSLLASAAQKSTRGFDEQSGSFTPLLLRLAWRRPLSR